MPRYIITETAGRFVAGMRNPGAGVTVALSPAQAAHDLRLGTLIPADAPGASEPAPTDLSAMTVADLRELAGARGIDLSGATRKAEIIAAIEGATG